MKKPLLGIGILILAIPLAIWAWDRHVDHQIELRIDAPISLYATEQGAAYHRELPIRILQPGERVIVERTTYGKDYWALRLSTTDGIDGWVNSGQPGLTIIPSDAGQPVPRREPHQAMGFSFTDAFGVTCTGFPLAIDATGCSIMWTRSDDGLGDFGAKIPCGEAKTICGYPYRCDCDEVPVVRATGGDSGEKTCVEAPLDTGAGCLVRMIDNERTADAGWLREVRMAYGEQKVLCGQAIHCRSAGSSVP